MASRAYGIGAYGTGRYGVGSATDQYVGAATSITLPVSARPTAIRAAGGATGITLAPYASPTRIWMPVAATQIRFALKSTSGLTRQVGGQTQIAFALQGRLVKTWLDGPSATPCEAGTWTQDWPPWTIRQAA